MGANAKTTTNKTTAPKSIQGEDNFYNSHCNLTQLPTIITTRNDKFAFTCGYLKKPRTQEKPEPKPRKAQGEDSCNSRSPGRPMELPTAAPHKDNLPHHPLSVTRKARTTARTNIQAEKPHNTCSHCSPSPPYCGLIRGPVGGAREAHRARRG